MIQMTDTTQPVTTPDYIFVIWHSKQDVTNLTTYLLPYSKYSKYLCLHRKYFQSQDTTIEEDNLIGELCSRLSEVPPYVERESVPAQLLITGTSY